MTADEENRHIIDPFDEVISLEPGGTVLDNDRSGGGSGSIDMALPRALGPDSYEAVLTTPAGEDITLTMTPRWTTPDGRTLTLPGKEDAA